MIIKEKSVEYYFDSREYTKEQIVENMKEEQIGFEKKDAKIDIILNEYGIYVATLKFENNKISLFKSKLSVVEDKVLMVKEKLPIAKNKVLKIKSKLPVIKDKLFVIKNKIIIKKDDMHNVKYVRSEIENFEKEISSNNNYERYNKDEIYGQYKKTKTYQPI